MIHVRFDMRDGHSEIRCTGHSDASDEQHACVCAGVSAIMQAAALGLTALAEEYPAHVRVEIEEA